MGGVPTQCLTQRALPWFRDGGEAQRGETLVSDGPPAGPCITWAELTPTCSVAHAQVHSRATRLTVLDPAVLPGGGHFSWTEMDWLHGGGWAACSLLCHLYCLLVLTVDVPQIEPPPGGALSFLDLGGGSDPLRKLAVGGALAHFQSHFS